MNEREKNSLSETASTARMIHGAVRTGKAISGAAKGAAMGGPYGAAIGAVLSSKKHIGAILAVVIVLLMLPVLFVLMLPSVIFGGLTSPNSSTNPDQPILNDTPAIIETTNNLAFAINQILGEGIDDVTTRIAADFTATSGDNYEIINPYEGNLISNTNSFLGQYCAAKNLDWKTISPSDLEAMLRAGKSHLYTYTSSTETRWVDADDPNTPDVVEQDSELWYIYTIVYNGERYFADTIFQLSDEQKTLADDYAWNLSLFLGDGMFQGIFSDEAMTGIPSLGDVTFTDGATEVVYFNQLDERYCNEPYGTDHIGGYGCGPTAMSIVVSSLTSDTVDPVEMSEWAYENGYWCSKSGSYHSLIPGAAEHWNLPVAGCTASEPQRILDALTDGKLVVSLMTKGHFTSSGHFIVLRGVQNEKILVADPSSYTRSQKTWDLSIILSEASRSAAAGGPFWIIG